MEKEVILGKDKGKPENIGSILQRVLEDLETKYQEKHGGRSVDLSPEALTFGRPASSPTGGEDGTTAPTTFK